MSKKKSNSVMEEHGIKNLTEYEHARIRAEMYLGSREISDVKTAIFTDDGFKIKQVKYVPALLTAFREIIDNSLDELQKAGIAGVLKIEYNEKTMEFSISDNGRGIPIDYVPETKQHLCTMVMTETKTGRNFVDSERKGVAGTNGLGGSIVMMVSAGASIEIIRTGKPYKTDKANSYTGMYKFTQQFDEGNAIMPELIICDPKISKVKSKTTGTTINFKLSTEVFKNMVLPMELVSSLLKEIAVANPQHKIYLNGKKFNANKGVAKSLFGLNQVASLIVDDEGFHSEFYMIPDVVDEGFHMAGTVNNAPSLDGGEHLDTFKRRFALDLLTALEKTSERRGLKPNRGDVEEGLFFYNITKMDAPYFNAQTKTKLVNENVIKPIEEALSTEFFDDLIKTKREWIDSIYERCKARTSSKENNEDKKLSKKLLKSKVAKLRDANSTNREDCILLIAEGDSAISSIIAARDTAIHGILPLRGKIKTVSGRERASNLMDSMALRDIMVSLGITPTEKANRKDMRFGKLYICTDEDVDGMNIAALVCNFLYKFWAELFDPNQEPFVYIFKTPFIIIEKKGKPVKYFYGHNIDEFDPEDWKDCDKPVRAKGLGTLNKEHFEDALNDGYAVPIQDDGSLGEILDLVFNKKRAQDRKAWMRNELEVI